MLKYLFAMSVLSAALLLQPVFGGVEQARADSITVDFEGDGEKDVIVQHGKTDIMPTCYNLDADDYAGISGFYFHYDCTSPVSNVTCQRDGNNNCGCHNPNNKSHTVVVHMKENCVKPPSE